MGRPMLDPHHPKTCFAGSHLSGESVSAFLPGRKYSHDGELWLRRQ
jgi:hypothetical protein